MSLHRRRQVGDPSIENTLLSIVASSLFHAPQAPQEDSLSPHIGPAFSLSLPRGGFLIPAIKDVDFVYVFWLYNHYTSSGCASGVLWFISAILHTMLGTQEILYTTVYVFQIKFSLFQFSGANPSGTMPFPPSNYESDRNILPRTTWSVHSYRHSKSLLVQIH